MTRSTGPAPFSGFTSEASAFFRGLRDDNSKGWFEAHRDVYEASVRQPLEDLLGQVQDAYGEGRVTRPNRDVRFSPDKSPYKTTASMWAGEVGGVYLSVGPDGLDVGGGLYGPSRDQLARARAAIADRPRAADDLRAIVSRLESRGFEMAGPPLKTAPRGYDRDHPQVELLRLTHYAAIAKLPVDASPQKIRGIWRSVEPLIAWTAEHVGPAVSWP